MEASYKRRLRVEASCSAPMAASPACTISSSAAIWRRSARSEALRSGSLTVLHNDSSICAVRNCDAAVAA